VRLPGVAAEFGFVDEMTLEQFLTLSETEPVSEFASGAISPKPMADGPHAAIQAFLAVVLFPYVMRTQLGRAFIELRCIFGPPGRQRSYVPDLTYVDQGKLPLPRYLHAAPDLAVEILSPDQPWAQFLNKVQFYLLYGVRMIWIIDPARWTITVETPGQEACILQAGDMLDGGEILPGFSVPIDEIFAQMPL
jgi:Uma2 family endonuclease